MNTFIIGIDPSAYTFIIGIDPSADTFTASVWSAPQQQVLAPHHFASTAEGFEDFAQHLACHGLSPENVLVAIENTGVYSEALCYELHRRSFPLVLAEPHKIWGALPKGQPKTDEFDSGRIAEYAYRYPDTLSLWQPNHVIAEQVKVLLTTREQLVQQKTALLNARTALQRKVIQTPAANRALDETAGHLKEQIKTIEQEIRRLIRSNPTAAQIVGLITSAPGMGLLMAAHLLVVTRCFTEKADYPHLAQYLGLSPNPHTSGTSVRRPARSRGYGPPMMRKLLHLAARSVGTHTPAYKQYYLRKRAEGKPRRLVLNSIANKLLRLVCSMIKNNKPYIENYKSFNPMLLTS